MGNRAVITTPERNLAVYLHWNGGRDFVEPLLHYCKLQDYYSPEQDSSGWVRLCQVLGNFSDHGHSFGIKRFAQLGDQGDNGVYVIKDWEIVERITYDWDNDCWKEFPEECEQYEYDFDEVLHDLNVSMPYSSRLNDGVLSDKMRILRTS